jgi:hypothetical protein
MSITLGTQQIEFNNFCETFGQHKIDLTRSEILSVLEETKKKNPALVHTILDLVKSRYHLSLVF